MQMHIHAGRYTFRFDRRPSGSWCARVFRADDGQERAMVLGTYPSLGQAQMVSRAFLEARIARRRKVLA